MFHIVVPTDGNTPQYARHLSFYLALEEWVAGSLPPGEYFFTWRVDPTVIIGRNQDAKLEVDLEYCRDHNIDLCRRRSGGGCVYADHNNLMVSFVSADTDVQQAFAAHVARMAEAVRALGLDARVSGRNDITVDDSKVSGTAYYLYQCPGADAKARSIVHGTLLYDVDSATMSHAITPSRSKLESKQVQSVAARVGSISTMLSRPMSVDEFERHIVSSLQRADGEYVLSAAEVSEVEAIEARYRDLRWIFGRRGLLGAPKSEQRIYRRIPGVGEFNVILEVADGVIKDIELTGDFFIIADLDSALFDRLRGVHLYADSLAQALDGVDVSRVIAGLDNNAFINLLLNNQIPK